MDDFYISNNGTCLQNYQQVAYFFQGTNNYCKANRGRFAGNVIYRECKSKVTERVPKDKCDFNGEKCEKSYSEESFREGDSYEGIEETFLFDYLEEQKLCFKKGSFNYYDISEQRRLFSENSNQVGCNPA